MTKIGSISSIVRYPVKSMAGETISAGFFGYAGLFGDRSYAFKSQEGRTGFPWFTIRQMEDLVRYRAKFSHPDLMEKPMDTEASLAIGPGVSPVFPAHDTFDVMVETPSGETFSIRDSNLKAHLESESGLTLSLHFSERALSDCRPISIFANSTISKLEEETGKLLDKRRFRANLYVEWDNLEPFYENQLIGRTIQIGERTRLAIIERDPRCKIITIDPDTGDESPQILRHISAAHAGAAGVYAAVLLEGVIHTGDSINLL